MQSANAVEYESQARQTWGKHNANVRRAKVLSKISEAGCVIYLINRKSGYCISTISLPKSSDQLKTAHETLANTNGNPGRELQKSPGTNLKFKICRYVEVHRKFQV
jgi:hypothetical protein